MDGLPRTTPFRAPRARRPAARGARLLAALTVLAALFALAVPPARAAAGPAERWPVGGAALTTAMALATEHWGMTPCGGQVALSWTGALGPGVNAQSSWANDVDPYGQPSRNTDCAIALSTRIAWDWPMLCTVVIHEVGHLTGHDHVDDEHDIMYYAYVEPAYECATTAEPVGPGTAVAVPAAAPPHRTAPKQQAAKASKPGPSAKGEPGAKAKGGPTAKARPKPKAKGRKASGRGRR
jgi:hypothetical protein